MFYITSYWQDAHCSLVLYYFIFWIYRDTCIVIWAHSQISIGGVCGTSDFKLVSLDVISLNLVEQKHLQQKLLLNIGYQKTMYKFWFLKSQLFFLRKWQLMSWNIYWYELIIALKLYHLVYPPHNTVISFLSWCFLVFYFCHTPYKHLV